MKSKGGHGEGNLGVGSRVMDISGRKYVGSLRDYSALIERVGGKRAKRSVD